MRFAVLFFCLAGVFLAVLPVSRAETDALFFESLYDVPVMDGLSEAPAYALVFDKPSGRIAVAAAFLLFMLREEDVVAFYARSLPQMGWSRIAPGRYVREREELTISFEIQGAKRMVFFKLKPR